MKNAVKLGISVAMISVVTMIFSGCSKDDDISSLVSGSFDGKVTANVDGGAGLMVNAILAINNAGFDHSGNFDGNVVGSAVAFTNGSFTITLPTSGFSSYLMDVTEFFEYFMQAGEKGKIKVSNPNARIVDVDFIGFFYDEDDDEVYVSGLFSYKSSDFICMFVFVDSDVNVTGATNISVSLKRGWNRVYAASALNTLTTKAPNGMKWYFDYF